MASTAPPSAGEQFAAAELGALAQARRCCASGELVMFRSLVLRLEALLQSLQHALRDEKDEDAFNFGELDLSLWCYRHGAFMTLVRQIQQIIGGTDQSVNGCANSGDGEWTPYRDDPPQAVRKRSGIVKMLMEAPRWSREAHWMHLQVDVLLPDSHAGDMRGPIAWQEDWEADCREQMQYLRTLLEDGEALGTDLDAAADEGSQLVLMMTLQNELNKLADGEDNQGATSATTLGGRELLSRALEEMSRIMGIAVGAVPDWFVASHEVTILQGTSGTRGAVYDAECNGLKVTVEHVTTTEDSSLLQGSLEEECTRHADHWYRAQHTHVVKLHGALHVGREPFFVYEAMEGSVSLVEYAKHSSNGGDRVWRRLFEVALALQYVHHDLGIAHGALRGASILVGADGKAKLKPPTPRFLGNDEGTWRWQSPERRIGRDSGAPSPADDVYGFAMCIIEAISQEVPFAAILTSDRVAGAEDCLVRPSGINDAGWELIEKMTSSEPGERLAMEVVARALLTLAEHECSWSDTKFSELLLHAPDVWTAFRTASKRHESGTVMCSRVLARLECVLELVWDEGLTAAGGENAEYNWQTRTDDLLRSVRFLVTTYLPGGGQRELLKLAQARRFSQEIRDVHEQLDAILIESQTDESCVTNESANTLSISWKLQWEYDWADLLSTFEDFLEQLDTVFAGQDGAVGWDTALEAMTLMKHDLDTFGYAFSDTERALTAHAFNVCVAHAQTVVFSPATWFIPAFDVRGGCWWEGVPVTVSNIGHVGDGFDRERASTIVFRQADLWSQLVHPHILKLFGAYHVGSTPFFVLERARGGSLRDYISKYRVGKIATAASIADLQSSGRPPKLWRLLHEVALGLQYLHERDIVNDDLHCGNICVVVEKATSRGRSRTRGQRTKREMAKLSGMNLVSLSDAASRSTSKRCRKWQWLAPERRCDDGSVVSPPSLASDVFAFGMCILEAVTYDTPWGSSQSLSDCFGESQSPECPSALSDENSAWELVKSMCAWQPEKRVSIAHAVQRLDELASREAKQEALRLRESKRGYNFRTSSSIRSEESESSIPGSFSRLPPMHGVTDDQNTGSECTVHKVEEMTLPGADSMTISQTLKALSSRVDGNSENRNAQILLRLQDIYFRLCEAERAPDSGVADSLASVAMSYASILAHFCTHVDEKWAATRIAQLAADRQHGHNEFDFHRQLDKVLRVLGVSESREGGEGLEGSLLGSEQPWVHDWKRQWYAQRAQRTQSFEWSLSQPKFTELLVGELRHDHEREETLAFLQFELTRHRSSYTAVQVKAINAACASILRQLSVLPQSLQLNSWRLPRWFIPPYEVAFDPFESFSHGSFASVHMGKWLDTPVVIKNLTTSVPKTDKATNQQPTNATNSGLFYRELSIWYHLNHPYVVKLFGGCHVGDRPFFVCEHASNGRLDAYLRRQVPLLVGGTSFSGAGVSMSMSTSKSVSTAGRSMGFSSSSSRNSSSTGTSTVSSTTTRSWRRGLAWRKLRQAALGLQYLHQHGIVHGDLKCDNILVAADGTAKLTDFGLSSMRNVVARTERDSENAPGASVVGAHRWKAPECLSGGAPTFESDVFSFGMCVLQAVSDEFPWGSQMPDVAVRFHVRHGKLPPRPQGFEDDAHWDLVCQMCCFNPQQRLKLGVVVQRLTRFADFEARLQHGGGGVRLRDLLFV